jgi:hypothetical protein
MSLRRRLANYGFESNDDYEFALKVLFESKPIGVRCLNVVGDSGRRKSALAHALANALEYPHVLYHDFSRQGEAETETLILDPETGAAEKIDAPVSAFDRALTEACAYSEAARVIVILDQLQASDFRDQVRLYQFAQSRQWQASTGAVTANAATFLLVLISEEPLYHSLQKLCFKVWADAGRALLDFDPKDYGWPDSARHLFEALSELFRHLGQSPTPSEFQRVIDDIGARVRSAEQLRVCLYGWIENLDRGALYSPKLQAPMEAVLNEIDRFLGVEAIELS